MTHDRSKATLDAILREARKDLVPPDRGEDGDFSAVEAKLFARIAQEPVPLARAKAEYSALRSRRLWGGVACRAAAAAVVFMLHDSSPPLGINGATARAIPPAASVGDVHDPASAALSTSGSAASFREREGAGDIRIGGRLAELGHGLALAESVETGDVRALFVSGQDARPAVTWLIEERSRVEVEHVQLPLVLALSKGAVEAQVAPVDHGEAFAVDIDGVRVAVHGTHLRVSREGGHVVVDLTEGVVAVGAIPSSGLTEGSVVTAPAHVEFDTGDLAGSLHLDHAAASIRTPIPLGSRSDTVHTSLREGVPPVEKQPAGARPNAGNLGGGPGGPGGSSRPEDARPGDTIAKGVRACVASQLRGGTVRVTVSSKLSLKVSDDGSVYFARFNPPLAPEAQECASRIIYKTRFAHGGDVEIPLSSE